MTHTPGPWESDGVVIFGPDGMIGEVGFGVRDDDEMKANAALMAASPALLASAVEFVRKVDAGEARSVRSYSQFKNAIAAYEKATA